MMAGFPWAKTPVYRGIPTKTKNTKPNVYHEKKEKNTGLVFHSTRSIRVFDGVFSNCRTIESFGDFSYTPKKEMHRLIHGGFSGLPHVIFGGVTLHQPVAFLKKRWRIFADGANLASSEARVVAYKGVILATY